MRPANFVILMSVFVFSAVAAGAAVRPFIVTVLEKEKVYVGEAVRVDYFLYSPIPPGKSIIRHYPAFDDFIKRFYFPDDTPRRVDYKGKKYWRSLHYQVRLFPLAVGRYKLDQLALEVELSPPGTIANTIARNEIHPFWKKEVVSGDQPMLEVLALPSAPSGFIGLVGKHEFRVTQPTADAKVNNPVKFVFEVRGTGSLEKFEIQEPFHHEALELLEKTSDFSENPLNGTAVKRLTFTYLPQRPLEIEARAISLFWFEPISNVFEKTTLVIGPLFVGRPRESDISGTAMPPHSVKLTGSSSFVQFGKIVGWAVAISWAVVSLFMFGLWWKRAHRQDMLSIAIKQIRRKGIDYSRLHLLFKTALRENETTSLKVMLEKLHLSSAATAYFHEAIAFAERVDYSKDKKQAGPLFVKKYFDELRSAGKMTSEENEDIQDD